MRYHFNDLGEMDCEELVQSISALLMGRRAVNVSFDSGIIQAPGWEIIDGLPVTPTITHDLLARWPVSHDAYCDEWWVFQDAVPDNFQVHPF